MPRTVESSQYPDVARREMLQFIPAGSACVLDVGCHTGAFGRMLKGSGIATVWGIEADPATAAEAGRHLDKVIAGYFADEQVPDGYFDVVVFNDVLEHIPDPAAALRIAAKKLKAGGAVVASIPNLRHIDTLVHIVREKDFRYEAVGVRDRTHLRFFTKKSIPRLFEQGDLIIEILEGINESAWDYSLVRRILFRLFPDYFDDTRFEQFAIVARCKQQGA
jgi:2-polyprenyl-3-methyl-5-hydroxy-6-metoxy-1,4-benzoquinol methylase